jgi:hypothetical protein
LSDKHVKKFQLNFESARFRDLGRLLQETVAAEGGICVSMRIGSVYGRQFDLKGLGLYTHNFKRDLHNVKTSYRE